MKSTSARLNKVVFKCIECLLFSVCLILTSLTSSVRAAQIDSRDELSHMTGLLLTTPGNSEVAKNVILKIKKMQKNYASSIGSLENQEILQLSAKALNIHKIKTLFDKCLKDKSRANDLGTRIIDSATQTEFKSDPCQAFIGNLELKPLKQLDQNLAQYMENEIKNLAIIQSQKNFAKTYAYWERRIDQGTSPKSLSEICLKLGCTTSEKNTLKSAEDEFLKAWPESERKKAPLDIANILNQKIKNTSDSGKRNLKSQDELLLFTKTLADKKSISKIDVLNAQKEVKELLEGQIKTVRTMNLSALIKTNPAAIGQILLEKPELTTVICDSINNIAMDEEKEEAWNKVYLWGGLIVGGTLLITGVGAGIGAMVLSATTLTGTLVTIATASAIAGSAIGIGETLYSGSKALAASDEALALRASALTTNGDQKTSTEAQEQLDLAWNELTSAGISAASLIPFGSIWKVMSKTAQVSKIGSRAKVEQIALKDKTEALKELGQTIRELKDPQLEKILIKAREQVSDEEYGSFLGQLSQLTQEQRLLVMTRMKEHPDKVSEAIRKGSQKGTEVCQ
jgi:hypothetical protein